MKNVLFELTNIVQNVALVDDPAEQVKLIVDSISRVIHMDVCSLYVVSPSKEMVLLASHGLVNADKIVLPPGKGLVGLVARTRHAINIAEAARHPSYYHVEQAQEDRYRSFCGVPLVRAGEVFGVLVVQSVQPQKLSEENEAFLATLASQLTLLIADIPVDNALPNAPNERIKGIKGAPGVGVGSVQKCDDDELDEVLDSHCNDVEATLAEWHELLDTVRSEIKREQALFLSSVSDSISGIFEAYQLLLSDPALINRVEAEIRARHSLPEALRLSIRYFSELFRAMEDPYLRARNEDIRHLGNKLFNTWRGSHKVVLAPNSAVILVGAQVSVSDIAAVPEGMLAGIVCKEGSSLSHTAVLANALGVPAVMGIGDIGTVEDGELIIVDGSEGQVILRPLSSVLSEYHAVINRRVQLDDRLAVFKNEPAITTDGERITLFTNTGLLADISPGLNNGAEGIGLYRTEIPFMIRRSFPTEEEQFRVYQKVFDAYGSKPVYMRTLDVGGDKQLPYFPITGEENPALGWRGIRFTLDNIQLQMSQVRAMIRASAGEGRLSILLPMISSSDELDTFIALLNDACDQLLEEGVSFSRPKVGVMLEVPAVISQLSFWAPKIDFVSIGSNDLSQYLLALDRNNMRVASRYDHLHPAVLSEINRAVGIARAEGLLLSLCGEMASDPEAVLLLLGMGVRTLSMSANKLPRIKWLIRTVSMDEAVSVVQQALTKDKVADIRALTRRKLVELGLDELLS